MTTAIRLFEPIVYRNLVRDWKSIDNWVEDDYMKEKIGNEQVESI